MKYLIIILALVSCTKSTPMLPQNMGIQMDYTLSVVQTKGVTVISATIHKDESYRRVLHVISEYGTRQIGDLLYVNPGDTLVTRQYRVNANLTNYWAVDYSREKY